MRKIVEEGGYALWEYRPSLFAPLYGNMDRPSFVRRVRLMQEYLSKGKYKACYLQVDGKFVGYNVFAPGGRRLKCSTTRDLVSARPMCCQNIEEMVMRLKCLLWE